MKHTLITTAALLTLGTLSSSAAIVLGAQDMITSRSSTFGLTLDASGADKLVVVMSGQHGFNNNAGEVSSLTYDGVALTAASYRTAVTAGTDTLYHGIFYLDNPLTSAGVISATVQNRGHMAVFLLTGTADGAGAQVVSANGTRTADLTTTGANSMVFFSQGLGGAGNNGNTAGMTADSGTLLTAQKDASNWTGQLVANQTIAAAGTNTFAFTGGNVAGGMVVATEFLEATVIPEPSTTALLGLGGLALILRRRK
ncbi:MAG: hypothetical protein ACJAR1_002486 [Rubritalea sp.]|jgi:hypothetical protein